MERLLLNLDGRVLILSIYSERSVSVKVQVKEWGNSQAIKIPKEILQDAGISTNEVLNISAINGAIVLSKAFRHRTLEERAAEYGGRLNLDGECDWGEPVGREVW